MVDFHQYIYEVKKNGSAVAFHKLVQLFENKVYTMCYRIIRNREEAEEAAQDVFLKCFRNIHQLEDDQKFPQWLLKIAYSKSIDYVRRKKIVKVDLDDIAELGGDINKKDVEGDLNRSQVLEGAMKVLEPSDVALINLYYQEDMSVKEIANLLDISESNVKVRLHRARAELRNLLEISNREPKIKSGNAT